MSAKIQNVTRVRLCIRAYPQVDGRQQPVIIIHTHTHREALLYNCHCYFNCFYCFVILLTPPNVFYHHHHRILTNFINNNPKEEVGEY